MWKGKIRTLPLKPIENAEAVSGARRRAIVFNTRFYVKNRDLIEYEIRQRQESWKAQVSDEPPTPHS